MIMVLWLWKKRPLYVFFKVHHKICKDESPDNLDLKYYNDKMGEIEELKNLVKGLLEMSNW